MSGVKVFINFFHGENVLTLFTSQISQQNRLHVLCMLECKSQFLSKFSGTQPNSLFLRSGCLKAMESTEKYQVRKTFLARSRKAKMLSATSTKIPQ